MLVAAPLLFVALLPVSAPMLVAALLLFFALQQVVVLMLVVALQQVVVLMLDVVQLQDADLMVVFDLSLSCLKPAGIVPVFSYMRRHQPRTTTFLPEQVHYLRRCHRVPDVMAVGLEYLILQTRGAVFWAFAWLDV